MNLKDKIAIVTGATSGIGEATTEAFAEAGAKVIFCGRRENKGLEIEAKLKEKGYEVTFVQADCTVDEDLDNLVSTTIDKYGTIDILYNNAGYTTSYQFENIDMEKDFDNAFNLNVRSYFSLTKKVIPYMLEKKSGSIINCSSSTAFEALPYISAYCASKAAVVQFTKALAHEYASRGIRVNAVCPGLTTTEMVPEGSNFEKSVIGSVPMQRAAQPIEVANVVVFLASDAASYMTGTAIPIDGGATL